MVTQGVTLKPKMRTEKAKRLSFCCRIVELSIYKTAKKKNGVNKVVFK